MSASMFCPSSTSLARAARDTIPPFMIDRRRPDSRYHGVYLCPSGSYRAKPRRGIHLGYYPTPTEAVLRVVEWWRSRYGDRWERVFQHKFSNPLTPMKHPVCPGRFIVELWAEGEPVVLGWGDNFDPGFASKAAALAAAEAWGRAKFGDGWRRHLWRS